MGLDMHPMGKPKPGFEKRYLELYEILTKDDFLKVSFWERLKGTKLPSKEELLKKWNSNQIQTYITIKAPRVGKDEETNLWWKLNMKINKLYPL